MNQQLSRIEIRGYKSIAHCDLEMKRLNILIGANGAGKSNFISFFKLMQSILDGKLQLSVSRQGGSDVLLHFGRKKTERLASRLYFNDFAYFFSLEPTQDHRMMYTQEQRTDGSNIKTNILNMPKMIGGDSGYFESRFANSSRNYDVINEVSIVFNSIKKWRVYHFHDTSDSAYVKQLRPIHDCDYLRPDARNLAAYLYFLQKKHLRSYHQIEKMVRLVAPFFGQFDLKPSPLNPEQIELIWYEKNEDIPFKAHQLSDGTLRFICLATVLLQPEEKKPECIIIDEPELGLHPYAITILASLIQSVSETKQVIVSTQSVDLLSEFSAEDVIVVNRENHQSVLTRLNENQLEAWLNEYSLGELWKKNILGGRPAI